jgi:azurin
MKPSFAFPLFALVASLALAGCGPKDSTPAPAPAAPAPAADPGAIDLSAGDNMKYDRPRIEVTPGLAITLTFTNTGNQPKTVMAHNFVLLKKDTDLDDFLSESAMAGKAADYIPASRESQILAHTKFLGAHQTDTIQFTAPTEPGEYPFVCTFPGHYLQGMHGVMVVK